MNIFTTHSSIIDTCSVVIGSRVGVQMSVESAQFLLLLTTLVFLPRLGVELGRTTDMIGEALNTSEVLNPVNAL